MGARFRQTYNLGQEAPVPSIRRSYVNLLLALVAFAFACAPAATSAVQTPPAPAAAETSAAPATATIAAPEVPTQGVATSPATAAPSAPAEHAAPTAVAQIAPATADDRPASAATADFSGLQAKLHVDVLAREIGSRPAGSEAQARAAQYVLEQLRGLGYEAELQPFPITYYEDRGASLTVAGAAGGDPAATTLVYSARGMVEGELVDAGLGRAGDFSSDAVRGKIALIQRGGIRFAEKVDNVAAAGAVGAVIYNSQPGNFSGSLAAAASIPAVSLSLEDGQALAGRLGRGPVTVRLAVDAAVEQRAATNVVATRPGGPQTVVIGGHFDSVSAGPGANDNGSGTAVMLELARVLATRPSPYTLKFVAFDAEEIGLLGSAHMVGQLSDAERRATRAMINLDMVGVGDQPRVGGSEELTRLAYPISAALGQQARPLGDGLNGASDHASFLRAGIPAIFLYRAEDPNYHSPADRAEQVDPANLEYAGRLVLGLLDALDAGR